MLHPFSLFSHSIFFLSHHIIHQKIHRLPFLLIFASLSPTPLLTNPMTKGGQLPALLSDNLYRTVVHLHTYSLTTSRSVQHLRLHLHQAASFFGVTGSLTQQSCYLRLEHGARGSSYVFTQTFVNIISIASLKIFQETK